MKKETKNLTLVITTVVMIVMATFCVQGHYTQPVAAETVDALKEESYVCQKLDEVTVELIGAQDLWAEAFQRSLLRIPYGYEEPEVYSMTYVLKVSFPSWDNELRSVHLPNVSVIGDGTERASVAVLRQQEFGRSCRENSFLIACTVSSDKPLSSEYVRVLISSGTHPEFAVYKEAVKDVFDEKGGVR